MIETVQNHQNIKTDKPYPVVLIGLMGAGKTTVGRALAAQSGREFLDADQLIEAQEAQSIPEIFSSKGEAYFRSLEKKVIRAALLHNTRCILSTGGGAFMQDDLRDFIMEHAISIYLDVPLDELVRRVGQGTGRPLLAGKNIREALENLHQLRHPVYSLADFHIPVAKESEDSTVRHVIKALKERHIDL